MRSVKSEQALDKLAQDIKDSEKDAKRGICLGSDRLPVAVIMPDAPDHAIYGSQAALERLKEYIDHLREIAI